MLREPRAVVFDLDGVLVDTARLHGRAWKSAFDAFFEHRGLDDVFDEVEDYRRHVDGRPRYEGVTALLRSREIEMPAGDPGDEPGFATEAAIGNLKNQVFHEILDSEGVDVLEGATELVEGLSASGVAIGVVSSSRNARTVMPDALGQHIEVLVAGDDLAGLSIPGKPDPAMFVEGATRLGARPETAAVVEDAPAGVSAGRRGGFAVTVGIDRRGASRLEEAGADVVITGVAALPRKLTEWPQLIEPPRPALQSLPLIVRLLADRPAMFLDYDGTLTPIVDHPDAAQIGEEERAVLRRLAEKIPVAVVSGRGLADVKSHVAVDGLTYSGSHGFEIERADGERFTQDEAAVAVPQLDEAEQMLLSGSGDLEGVMVERKPFAIAVHTRMAASDDARMAAARLSSQVAERFDGLVLRGGKEVHELRPALDWDKGAALSHLLGLMPGNPVPVYIGDDETDEDAFLAVRREGGLGILVGSALGAETWADFTLSQPRETIELLEHLAGAVSD